MATELALLLSYDVPEWTGPFLSLGYKFDPQGFASTRIDAGPIAAIFSPNQRNWSFTDHRINFTMHCLHAGGPNLGDHVGIQVGATRV